MPPASLSILFSLAVLAGTASGQPAPRKDPAPAKAAKADTFEIESRTAYVYASPKPGEGKPWIWYAPTINGSVLIAKHRVYFDAFMEAGLAVAGFDLGEVRGAPASTAKFTQFYDAMVKRGYSKKPILLGQSRGGLMTLAWAAAHPDKVRAWVGIYPVCNLFSWPLKSSKRETLADFNLTEDKLVARLREFNPIDNLAGLAKHQVPMFSVHGDKDGPVPFDDNTKRLKENYEAAGGTCAVKLIPGAGHAEIPAFFECPELLEFVRANSRPPAGTSVRDGWVTVVPAEFAGAINNPLKGFRDYKPGGYGLLKRAYIKWSDIEVGAGDTVDRIVAHTNKITVHKGKRFEELNVKLVPRVYLDWNGAGTPQKPEQHWPADLHAFDYDSPAFQERLAALVAKLGQAWDDDPRIFAVQMGLIGRFGEHHNPAPTADQRRRLADAFQKAFKNKPVLVRHTDAEFMAAGFGVYYDTFANISREPPDGPQSQFPWQALNVHKAIWKRAPIEGEVEYNWQKQRADAKPKETFGLTPNETMTVPAYRRYMIDKIRLYHASYLGWIDDYDPSDRDVLAGAAEVQKAFGYRFVIDSVGYPLTAEAGNKLAVKLAVRNAGSAPFYLDWPVGVALPSL